MLKGIDIILYEKTKTGEDAFHAPIYTETPVTVHNVLVGEPATEDIVNDLQSTAGGWPIRWPAQGRRQRLAQRDGGVLGTEIPDLRRCGAGH